MIEFDEVGFSYGRAPVLRETTLTLAPASMTVVVGPPGAGKTTLVRLCHRDLLPTGGRMRFFGGEPGRRDRRATAVLRRRIGLVPQSSRFIDHLSVLDNVALPLRVAGAAPDERADDLRALLDWVELGDRAALRPAELTAADRWRAALARAVILSPEVIVADEPCGAVSRPEAEALVGLLADLHRMGKAVLLTTRDPAVARAAGARTDATLLALGEARLVAMERAA